MATLYRRWGARGKNPHRLAAARASHVQIDASVCLLSVFYQLITTSSLHSCTLACLCALACVQMSVDGLEWTYSGPDSYNTTVVYEGGTVVTFSRRERPELVLDSEGNPTHLITGVTETGGRGGQSDRSFTLVQPVLP